MPEYAAQVSVEDRWAIAAYIRALQLSQNAKQGDVASGAQVAPLSDIEKSEGFNENFAESWELPATASYGTPDKQGYVLPGNGSAPSSGPAPENKPAAPATAAKPAPAAQQ